MDPAAMTLDCGCTVEPDPASGVLRSASKCDAHRAAMRPPAGLDEAYYASLGLLADGDLPHVGQLVEALGPIPPAPPDGAALEVGCGASPYAGAIEAAGWAYLGLDASDWAAEWTARRWGVATMTTTLEAFEPERSFGLILAAHVLEHLEDAPGAVARLAGMLAPGGELRVVVPDDSDLANPDHLFFFNELSLYRCLERAGLEVVDVVTRQYVERESFLYARAWKAD